jgi:predicted PurR-regulated permease PerM
LDSTHIKSATTHLMHDTPPEPAGDGVNPPEDDRPQRWLDNRQLLMISAGSLAGLFVLGLLGALYFAKAVFFPITLAVLLKLVFSPVVRRLNDWRVPYFAGAALVVGAIFGLVVGGVVFLSGPASNWFDEAPAHFRELQFKLRSLKRPMEKVTDAGDQVAKLTVVEGKDNPIPVQIEQPGVTALVVSTTGEVAVGGFLTMVMLYFLLAGGDRFLEKVVMLTPQLSGKKNVVAMTRDIQQSMSSYLFAMTCINAALGIVIGLAMWAMGLPNPALWGVMAACLNFIPYFGAILGGAIVFFVGVISLDSLAQAVWAPMVYFSVNAIEGYFITPSVLGRSISLSPLAIIVGMILWGWLWGVAGLLLAVPILAATKIACDHIGPLQPFGQLLGR